jgi:hypothetical protein
MKNNQQSVMSPLPCAGLDKVYVRESLYYPYTRRTIWQVRLTCAGMILTATVTSFATGILSDTTPLLCATGLVLLAFEAYVRHFRSLHMRAYLHGDDVTATVVTKRTTQIGAIHKLTCHYQLGKDKYTTSAYVTPRHWLSVNMGDSIVIRVHPEKPWTWLYVIRNECSNILWPKE